MDNEIACTWPESLFCFCSYEKHKFKSCWNRFKNITLYKICVMEGNDNPLQYSCLENSTDRGAWQATVLVAEESDTMSD